MLAIKYDRNENGEYKNTIDSVKEIRNLQIVDNDDFTMSIEYKKNDVWHKIISKYIYAYYVPHTVDGFEYVGVCLKKDN